MYTAAHLVTKFKSGKNRQKVTGTSNAIAEQAKGSDHIAICAAPNSLTNELPPPPLPPPTLQYVSEWTPEPFSACRRLLCQVWPAPATRPLSHLLFV